MPWAPPWPRCSGDILPDERREKEWTYPPPPIYKQKRFMAMTGRITKFSPTGLVAVALGVLTTLAVSADEGRGPLKGLLRGKSAESGSEEGVARSLDGGQGRTVTVAPSVSTTSRSADRPGEGNRFARDEGAVRVPRNATAARRESRTVAQAGSQSGPYNPKFGVPVFEPDPGPAGPTLAQGGVHTARGAELTRYVPVEVKEDRKAERQAQAQPAGPTPDDLKAAAERKQELFDEIYTSKSMHPPLTFESTVDRGPAGSQGPTREVGDRVLRQYVPTGPAPRREDR